MALQFAICVGFAKDQRHDVEWCVWQHLGNIPLMAGPSWVMPSFLCHCCFVFEASDFNTLNDKQRAPEECSDSAHFL